MANRLDYSPSICMRHCRSGCSSHTGFELMPYYISSNTNLTGCPRWAVVKEDGETLACHRTKTDAIAQMVAVSRAEKIAPGGDWENKDK